MKAYWSQTKLNGSPLAPGQVCWIQDYTDEGLGKVPTYGASVEEVLEKLSRTNASAQTMIAAQKSAPLATSATRTAAPATPSATPRLSADQRMQATADLQNPATAGKAVAQLFADETGLSIEEMVLRKFSSTCLAWEQAHPEFVRTPANQKLMAQAAIMRAGQLKSVTAAHLDAAFTELQQGGYLSSETSHEPPLEPTPSPSEQAPETVPPTPARPRMATTHRTGRIGAPQISTSWKPKWTREQIVAMPLSESRRLVESGDQEFAKACEHYWPSRPLQRATA